MRARRAATCAISSTTGAAATATSSCSMPTASCAAKRIVDLVKLMEAHPDVGLIQTVPALINAAISLRPDPAVCQPALRAHLHYRPELLGAGFGNYWGHNAIIRTEPFMQCCDLPQLPGAQTLRRPHPQPRLRGGGPDAPSQLAGLVRLRSGRQLRGGAAGHDRKRPTRPPLVPGQPAARHGALRARTARASAGSTCCSASSATWPARSGCCSC